MVGTGKRVACNEMDLLAKLGGLRSCSTTQLHTWIPDGIHIGEETLAALAPPPPLTST
jgi:hypothetical protein